MVIVDFYGHAVADRVGIQFPSKFNGCAARKCL